MSQDNVTKPIQSAMNPQQPHAHEKSLPWPRPIDDTQTKRHPFFHGCWIAVNVLLLVSIFLAIYSAGWEFSTRRYLKGFSDAIVPATSPGDEKVEAILRWMAHGPARKGSAVDALQDDRDPTDTLNYEALLQVCGTATNAFVNLVDTGHMEVRRLLLVDSRQMTKHVVAEVLVDGRWIIVDPTYRVVMRGADGKALTREELSDPAALAVATRDLPGYDPSYTYDRVVHIRLARFHLVGSLFQRILDRAVPGWEDTPFMTLLVERESFAAMVSSFLVVIFLVLLRTVLRWYGEKRLGVRSVHIRQQLRRAAHAFLDAT
jgi:hypothetical protein